jgi:hypothetical protein
MNSVIQTNLSRAAVEGYMPQVSQRTVLEGVEHILGSGNGTLDFAVEGENQYYTWRGNEDAEWDVENVDRIENAEEDRFVIYPEGEYFVCEIEAEREEGNSGPVHCFCE